MLKDADLLVDSDDAQTFFKLTHAKSVGLQLLVRFASPTARIQSQQEKFQSLHPIHFESPNFVRVFNRPTLLETFAASSDCFCLVVKLEEAIEQFQIQTEQLKLGCEKRSKAVCNQLHSAEITKDVHQCESSPSKLLTNFVQTEFHFEDNLPFLRPKEFSWKTYAGLFFA